MADPDSIFIGSMPTIYERHLGPVLFQPYAEVLSGAVIRVLRKPGLILETAAGTGILTRTLARVLPRACELVATDLNQSMLDVGAAHRRGLDRVRWQQADAMALPFPDQHFEMVVCQFGAMFFPDKVAGFREARRVLKPEGILAMAIWDRLADNDFAAFVTATLAKQFPRDPPRFLARVPHGYNDVSRTRAQLFEAGFTSVDIETVTRESRAPAHYGPAIGFCQGTPLLNEIVARDPQRLDDVTEVVAEALGSRFGYGAIVGKMQAHIVLATV
jgi:ubiquinone/menaquinone biosynthesis C-methylase UbiE